MGRARADRIRGVYDALLGRHGDPGWWPGDGAFEIMVGAVLTQNTAWRNVERALGNLKDARALSPRAIVGAHPRRLAAWLRPSGYYNVKARRLRALCWMILQRGGIARLGRMPTPQLREALLEVHGVGPETADDILLYAFDRPVFVIDAYTRRIFTRLGVIGGDERYEALRRVFEEDIGPSVPVFKRYHGLIVTHAKDVCRVRPRCEHCVLAQGCRRAARVGPAHAASGGR
jgi:endonuclease-3 related protein